MNEEERDAGLERLFVAADADLDDRDFSQIVLTRIAAVRGRRVAWTLAACALALPALALIALSINRVLPALMHVITQPLATTPDGIATVLLAPVNSVGALLVLGVLMLWISFKKVLS